MEYGQENNFYLIRNENGSLGVISNYERKPKIVIYLLAKTLRNNLYHSVAHYVPFCYL